MRFVYKGNKRESHEIALILPEHTEVIILLETTGYLKGVEKTLNHAEEKPPQVFGLVVFECSA